MLDRIELTFFDIDWIAGLLNEDTTHAHVQASPVATLFALFDVGLGVPLATALNTRAASRAHFREELHARQTRAHSADLRVAANQLTRMAYRAFFNHRTKKRDK